MQPVRFAPQLHSPTLHFPVVMKNFPLLFFALGFSRKERLLFCLMKVFWLEVKGAIAVVQCEVLMPAGCQSN